MIHAITFLLLYVAREHLNNTIILDGDQMIFNTDILKPEFDRSGYNSVYVEKWNR